MRAQEREEQQRVGQLRRSTAMLLHLHRFAAHAAAEVEREQLAVTRAAHTIHMFSRTKWTQVAGGKWQSENGRVLSNESYQRLQQRVKSTPASVQPVQQASPRPKQAAPGPPAVVPPLHPTEAAHLEESRKADTAKHGPEHANWLHRAAHAVRAVLAGGNKSGGARQLINQHPILTGTWAGNAIGDLAGPVGGLIGAGIGGLVGAYQARQQRRQAIQQQQAKIAKPHSEPRPQHSRFSDLSLPGCPNPGALVSARLKVAASKAGVKLPAIPPELVQQCLAEAQESGQLQHRFAATGDNHPFSAIAQALSQAPAVHPAHSQGAFDTASVKLHPNLKSGLASHVIALGSQRDPGEIEKTLQSLWNKAVSHTHAANIRMALMRHAYRLPRVAVGPGGNAVGDAILQFLDHWPEDRR